MDLQHLFDILVGIIVTIVGFFAKHVHEKAEKVQSDLASFKTHVAENYAHNGRIDEIKDIVANTNARVDDIYKLLTKGKNREE